MSVRRGYAVDDPNRWATPGRPPAGPPPPRPGVIPLRPLAAGEILGGAVGYIRAHPAVTLGLAAVLVTLTQLVLVPAQYFLAADLASLGTAGTPPSPQDVVNTLAAAATAAAVGGVLTFVAITVLTGLLIIVLSRAVLGQPIAAGEVWAVAGRRLPGLVGLSLLVTLIVIIAALVAALPALVAAAAGAPVAVTVTLGAVGVVGGLCLLVYLYVALAMAAPVYMLERTPAVEALARSRRLVQPQWWRVFGVLLLAAVIVGVINGIITFPASLAGGVPTGPGDAPAAPGLPGLIVAAIGTILAGTLTAPFSAGVTGLLYVDQRIRQEGLDSALARAAGVPPGPAPPSR